MNNELINDILELSANALEGGLFYESDEEEFITCNMAPYDYLTPDEKKILYIGLHNIYVSHVIDVLGS